MELRIQNKEITLPNSLGYNPAHRDASSKVPALGERRRDHQTVAPLNVDHQSPTYHQQQLGVQGHTYKHPKEVDTASDPALASNATAKGATNTTPPDPSRSVSRSPPSASANSPTSSVRYRECLKNHAANMGAHVVDGCGEFMPGGEDGTVEAMKCAACDCHRNFHRKEIDGEPQYLANSYYKNNHQRNALPPPQQLHNSLPPPQHLFQQHHRYAHGLSVSTTTNLPIAPMMMSFGGGGGGAAESSSEDLNMFQSSLQAHAAAQASMMSKKRFRTKFTSEQKEKMVEFAEKLEWKIQKQNEDQVQQFCSQVGIKRKVFKVWMHNNKQAMKKKEDM